MKKYILKKDLPFAKAGAKINESASEGCIPLAVYEHSIDISKEFIEKLLSEGWIEEVKPREYWVRILDKNHIEITQNEIELAGWSFSRTSDIIKVREVIK